MADLTVAQIENLLSEKLLEGYVLLESSCPVCSTPLVKSNHMVPKVLTSDSNPRVQQLALVPSESFDKPFKPVPGVPVCVACRSHVITQECEISILERCDSLKDKGSILVALKDSLYGDESLYSDESDPDAIAAPRQVPIEEEKKEEEYSSYADDEVQRPDARVNKAEEESDEDVIEVEEDVPRVPQSMESFPIFVEETSSYEIIRLENLPSPSTAAGNIQPTWVDDNQETMVTKTAAEPKSVPTPAPPQVPRQAATTLSSAHRGDGVNSRKSKPSQPSPAPPARKVETSSTVAPAEPAIVVVANSTVDDTTATTAVDGANKDDTLGVDSMMEEYSVRREIATKVLGSKMMQGFSLVETTCDRCGMPQMEKIGQVECVVCPALVKKAKKKMKAQQRLEEEKAGLEREIHAKKMAEKKRREEQLERERLEREEFERIERERREMEERRVREENAERLRIAQLRREMEEERARLLALEAEEEARIAHLEAEEARLLQEARNRAMEAAREQELENQARKAKEVEEERRWAEIQKNTEERLAAERQKQKAEEEALLEEARRLAAFEDKSLATTEAMQKDLLEQEHRRRLVEKARLDEEISELEALRHDEEMEIRRRSEERRAEEEARMIAALEADAASKALAAEDAIRKAKHALESVSSTKRDIIAQTIAMAEKEAIAETEEVLKAELENHREAIILQSESQLQKERWETLRMEGRAIMTRRVLQGWKLLPQACEGTECQMSPLITKLGRTECVVCGGTGNGCDGVYASEHDDDEMSQTETLDPSLLPPREVMTPNQYEEHHDDPLTYGTQEDFEEKRDLVSKEIGKRMLWGWMLLDASCPKCVMPLMMDNSGNMNICVLHGQVDPYFDASSEKVSELDMLKDTDEHINDGNTSLILDEKRDGIVEESILQDTNEGGKTLPQQNQVPSVAPFQLETVASLPEEEQTPKEDDLFKTIRERFSRQNTIPTPRGDPPAFTKALSQTVYEQPIKSMEDTDTVNDERKHEEPAADTLTFEEDRAGTEPESFDDEVRLGDLSQGRSDDDDESITITIPKNFDFADPEAVKQLMKVAAGEDINYEDEEEEEKDEEEDEEEDESQETVEVTNNGVSYEGKDVLSTEMVTKMFLSSPQGYDIHDLGSNMSLDDIRDLVDIFMVTNFDEPVTDEFKLAVARDIAARLQPHAVQQVAMLHDEREVIPKTPPSPTAAIIRLEHMPSPGNNGRDECADEAPRAFHFDDYPDAQSTRSSSRRTRPSPETIWSARSSSRSVAGPRPPISPRRKPPRSGGTSRPIVVGGPFSANHRHHGSGNYHDTKSIGEVSRASSVASDALESIYAKMDQCKATLMDPTNTIDDQLSAADLLEKLAKAALAVRAMEKLEAYE